MDNILGVLLRRINPLRLKMFGIWKFGVAYYTLTVFCLKFGHATKNIQQQNWSKKQNLRPLNVLFT